MKRIVFVVVPVLALFTVALGQMKVNRTTQAGNPEEELMRVERDWADAFLRREPGALRHYLADDFRLTTSGGESDRAQFLESAEHWAAGLAAIELSERRVRIDGGTAVSNGIATFKPRAAKVAASQPSEIRGEAATATGSAVVNVAELAREEAQNPPAQNEKAIHPPMSTPDNLPPPEASAAAPDNGGGQYRYTVVYVRRSGRWQAVSLQLTRVAHRD